MENAQTGDTGSTGNSAEVGSIDIEAAATSIGEDLFGSRGEDTQREEVADPEVTEEAQTEADSPETTEEAALEAAEPAAEEVAETEAVAAPKSWAKDKHEVWAKMPKEAQEYYMQREQQMLDGLEQYKADASFAKPLKEVISPYMPMIQARGIDAPKAVAALLNAQYQLDQNPRAGLLQIAKTYGVDLAELAQSAQQGAAEISPEVKSLQTELSSIKTALTANQEREYQAAREKVAVEVNNFAADPKNPYFDEVADDIVRMLQTGESLEKAYEKAVWANPVTRAKELARVQKEQTEKLRVKNKGEVETAKKAVGSNVRSRDTSRSPTESTGTIEDTMRETLSAIRKRPH